MNHRVAYPSRSISPQEQALYGHLLAYAEYESPECLIERFQSLFIDGVGYSDPEIVTALDQIISDRDIEEYFHFILNRCCHILINRWQSNPQLQYAVPSLIDLFETPPHATLGNILGAAKSGIYGRWLSSSLTPSNI